MLCALNVITERHQLFLLDLIIPFLAVLKMMKRFVYTNFLMAECTERVWVEYMLKAKLARIGVKQKQSKV